MSSVISSAYDAIVTRMGIVLPSHTRISNPYSVDENPEPMLRLGWGLRVADGVNSNRMVNCQLSTDRKFVIVLTRKYYARELDVVSKASTEKDLLEDNFLVIQDFEKNTMLGAIVAKANYESDTGIQFVFNQDKPFYKIESTLSVEYFDQL